MIFGIFVLLRVIMCIVNISDCNTITNNNNNNNNNNKNLFKVVKVTKTQTKRLQTKRLQTTRPQTKPTQTLSTQTTRLQTLPTQTKRPQTSSKILNPTKTPKIEHTNIPISSGNSATLTYFTDTVFQCIGINEEIPEYAVAVNPLLLGFTLDDWNNKYSGANSNDIPWCGKMMNITVNGRIYTARIIDTCNPGDNGAFIDPNTGEIIGGKCDYTNVIDLYGETGRSFLQSSVGDDFYQGDLEWEII
jgi:hypothetical protein